MPQIIVYYVSPNGVVGRVLDPQGPRPYIIVYPAIFLGLPFDVYANEGENVYGPDVPADTTDAGGTAIIGSIDLTDAPASLGSHLDAGAPLLLSPSDPSPKVDPQ